MEPLGLGIKIIPWLILVLQGPVVARADLAFAPLHPLGRQQFPHALEHAARRWHLEEIDEIEQALGVQIPARCRVAGDHVRLAGEHQALRGSCIGQLFRADAVQGQECALVRLVQDGQAEIAVDVLRRFLAMLAPKPQQVSGGGGRFAYHERTAADGRHQAALPGHGKAGGQAQAVVGQYMSGTVDAARGKYVLQGEGGLKATMPQPAGEAMH